MFWTPPIVAAPSRLLVSDFRYLSLVNDTAIFLTASGSAVLPFLLSENGKTADPEAVKKMAVSFTNDKYLKSETSSREGAATIGGVQNMVFRVTSQEPGEMEFVYVQGP